MEGFRFSIPYAVRAADVNYGGHVSNAAVLNYFQDARIAYLGALGPYSEMDVGEGCGIIMPEARVRYLAEMFLGEQLEIGVRTTALGRTSLTLAYRIERAGTPTAEGETPVVAFDYRARRPRRLPVALRQAIETLEGESLPPPRERSSPE